MEKKETLVNIAAGTSMLLLDKFGTMLLFGKDNDGCYCFTISGDRKICFLKETKCLQFNYFQDAHFTNLQVKLNDRDGLDIFISLCSDLENVIRASKTKEEMYSSIEYRLKFWKKMFTNSSKLLTEKEVQGLYGEMYFLDNCLIPYLGIDEAVKSWAGPMMLSKDFAHGLEWFEVKCINAMEKAVSISSHEQLLSDNPGNLVVIKVEKMGQAFENGIASINNLFKKIELELKNNPQSLESFREKCAAIGFYPDISYDAIRYKVVSIIDYAVEGKFPRIVNPEEFGEAFAKISYSLLLGAINDFIVEEPVWMKID